MSKHREIFFAAQGFGPYQCFECERLVSFEDVKVHHVDFDHRNNDPHNLVAIHASCHYKLHGRRRDPELKRKWREASHSPKVKKRRAKSLSKVWSGLSEKERSDRVANMRAARWGTAEVEEDDGDETEP